MTGATRGAQAAHDDVGDPHAPAEPPPRTPPPAPATPTPGPAPSAAASGVSPPDHERSRSARPRSEHRGPWWRVEALPARGLVAGVAAGLAYRLGVPTSVVRVAFVVLAAAGGAGAIAYLALWVVAVPAADDRSAPAGRVARRKALALIPILLGALILLRAVGLWFGDGLVWPVALAGMGALVIGARADDEATAPVLADAPSRLLTERLGGPRGRAVLRVGAGALLVAVGMVLLLATIDTLSVLGDIMPALAVTVLGLSLIVGPVIYRLLGQLNAERTDRIRSEERAVMAAHLHDSVLQTLAMIQRSGSAREMTTLARAQERELRTWLFSERGADAPAAAPALTLRDALDDVTAKIEARHHVSVDTVVVGDRPVTDAVHALIDACGEAVTNAANHAGVTQVSVYVEVEPSLVTAFVRDEGTGFDPDTVPGDRRGISHSICDRVERHHGSAVLTTAPGAGTEWELSVPVDD